MRVKFEGATILLTGASAGIGREMARELAGEAGKLILLARRSERLEALARELELKNPKLKVEVHAVDLADEGELGLLLNKIPCPDIIINNAGSGDITLFEDADWAKTSHMLRTNVHAPLRIIHHYLKPMVRRRSGAILNVTSTAGRMWVPGMSAYVGTKYFMNGLTEALRSEFVGTGVVMCQVCPGPVKTEFETFASVNSDLRTPDLLRLDARRCARSALRAFRKGKPLHVPGPLMQVFSFFHHLEPFFVRRLFMYALGHRMRRSLRKG